MMLKKFTNKSVALYFTLLSGAYADQIVIDGIINQSEWSGAQVVTQLDRKSVV